MKTSMNSLIQNYLNGNITTARKQAKRFTYKQLREALREQAGYSLHKALLTADFLKTGEGWQEACDAV